jgi:hypothetical protein
MEHNRDLCIVFVKIQNNLHKQEEEQTEATEQLKRLAK